MAILEFFFDVGSPFTYLAHTQMPGLAERTGARVVYRPMLLGGVFKATGNTSPIEVKPKGVFMEADLRRFAGRYGVPFRFNPHFPIMTIQLMRGAVAADEDGEVERFADTVFTATWVEGRNMNEPAVASEVLKAAGFDVERLFARSQQQEVKDKLRANTDEAVARGAFGAPTFFIGEQMLFGQDRLDFVEEALRAKA